MKGRHEFDCCVCSCKFQMPVETESMYKAGVEQGLEVLCDECVEIRESSLVEALVGNAQT